MSNAAGPPQQIFIIRHGEKPADPPAPGPPFGIRGDGSPDEHSLTPRGWQRSGGLVGVFAPLIGGPREGLSVPDRLVSPVATDPAKTPAHRTYQTIQALSDQTKAPISSPYPEGAEHDLMQATLRSGARIVLICWEHHHLPSLGAEVPTTPGTELPAKWPGDRFDVIWAFTLAADGEHYDFGQQPQLVLPGDIPDPIPIP